MDSHLELWDYRRRVAAIYGAVRIGGAGEETWSRWTAARDHLFSTHPQTPIDNPATFEGLAYYPYDERLLRVPEDLENQPDPEHLEWHGKKVLLG